MMRIGWVAALAVLLLTFSPRAVEPDEYAIQVWAQSAYSPTRLILRWPANPAQQIVVRRKLPADGTWGAPIATLPSGATSFTDANVDPGLVYEYQLTGVLSSNPSEIAYGYLSAGVEVYAIDRRGAVLLIVDRTHASALNGELEMLRQDLIGDGWNVIRREVSPTDSPTQVKAVIKNEYNADPTNVRAVFLFGHVPVPYSGLINPDMHPTHLGAWPADAYYGEMDGNWTDFSVNQRDSEYDENNNIPGDGKFDQSVIPGNVELQVGRVDMWGLTAFQPRSERELLRNYLNKNHRFRHGLLTAAPRGLIRDTFGTIDDDAPAVDAWRAIPALFGGGAVREVGSFQFFPTLANESFLLAYGGGGGGFEKADGVGDTGDFAASDPRAIFYFLHGSYFGDWNGENNFLRAAIATPTYGLVSIWTSLPHWYFHPMAVGETIGYVTRLNQNNRGLYKSNRDFSFGEAHISMQGDPTLRPFVAPAPRNLRFSVGSRLILSWDEPPGGADGYNIFRAATANGPFTRLNRGAINTNRFEHTLPPLGDYVYMVKSEVLQTTGGGSFRNPSQGTFIPYTQTEIQTPTVTVAAIDSVGNENGDPIVFEFTRNTAFATGLDLNIQISGTALAGEDFPAPSAVVSFAAGESQTKVTIVPSNDNVNELDESISLKILSGTGYEIGDADSAQATITANGQSQIIQASLSETGALVFNATGFANRSCRIESRTPDGDWRLRSTQTSGADGSIIYRESSPPSGAVEFYRLVWE